MYPESTLGALLLVASICAAVPDFAGDGKPLRTQWLPWSCEDQARTAIRHYREACRRPESEQCRRAAEALERLCRTCAAACVL